LSVDKMRDVCGHARRFVPGEALFGGRLRAGVGGGRSVVSGWSSAYGPPEAGRAGGSGLAAVYHGPVVHSRLRAWSRARSGRFSMSRTSQRKPADEKRPYCAVAVV
jgi:hypothetical protein